MDNKDEKFPLLSIVVITYNSSAYVLDTLESAYRQTYKGDIELIIADDCSSDDTVELCKNWKSQRETRFHSVQIIETPQNEGVSKNINRGCRLATGEWIKPIAGDDILADQCLGILYEHVLLIGDSCSFIYTPLYCFKKKEELDSVSSLSIMDADDKTDVIDLNYASDNPMFWVPAPGFFLRRNMLEAIGFYPEIFRNIEDMPLQRKVVAEGYPIHRMQKPIVFYRINDSSLTKNSINKVIQCKIMIELYELYMKPHCNFIQRWDCYFRYLPMRVIILLGEKADFSVFAVRVLRAPFVFSLYKRYWKLFIEREKR